MPTLTKAEKERKRIALAMAFRRAILNGRAREEKAAREREAKAQARHEKAMVRREGTNKLAAQRIEGCRNYPSPHAARQLGAIVSRDDLSATNRVEAAATLLDWGHADTDPMAEALERRNKRPGRKPKVRPLDERLHSRG